MKILAQTSGLQEAETSTAVWKGFRPTEAPAEDALQPTELPAGLHAHCGPESQLCELPPMLK